LTSSVALFLLAHFLSNAPALAVAPSSAPMTMKWSADLQAAVGGAPLGLVVGHGHETHLQPKTSLWFLDNNTIVATFVIRQDKPNLSGRTSSDPNLPLQLRAIFLDANTGEIKRTQAWPTESRFAGIVAAHRGTFVTLRGTNLALYSPDAKNIRELTLPPIPEDHWGWHSHPSPTGGSLLFETPDLTTTSDTPWIWVATDSLQIVRSWKEKQSGGVGISDTMVAMIACNLPLYHCNPDVEVKGLTTEWKGIAPIDRRPQSYPQFVNEETLFVSGHPWKLLRTDGKVELTEDPPFEGSWAVPSAGGQRFIVPFFKQTGAVPALDIGAHGVLTTISVYDAPFHERSYKMRMIGPKIKDQGTHLALSPDGCSLSILEGESIHTFQLPPPKSPPGIDAACK
jgi:hypothetical protein